VAKSCSWGLKLWIEVATEKLKVGDFGRDHLVEGRLD